MWKIGAGEDAFEPFSGCHVPQEMFESAAELGRSEILKWLIKNHQPLHNRLMGYALLGNHLQLAKWLNEHVKCKLVPSDVVEVWASFGAKHGNLDMIKWVCSLFGNVNLNRAVNEAVENGHLHVLRWILPQIPIDFRFRFSLDEICLNDNLEMVEWLIRHYPKNCYIAYADEDAAESGRLDIIRLLHMNNISGCSSRIIYHAASEGHLDIVKWIYSCKHKPRFDRLRHRTINGAAANGHLEIVKWLHENTDIGCSTAAMDGAVRNNHFEIVQWLHEHRSEGCTKFAMDVAASNGNMKMIQWFNENRTEGCSTDAIDWTAGNGHLEVVKWLHENREEGCTTDAMDSAAECGHLDVIKWLHEMRSEGCTTEAMDGAAENGHLDVVQWLHENRSEGCTTEAMDGAAKNQFWGVIEWLGYNRSEGATAAAMASIAGHGDMEAIILVNDLDRVPFDATVIALAVFCGHFEIARFLQHEQEWNGCDLVRAIRECPYTNRRWQFVEWMHSNHRDEFEKMAENICADT